MEKVRARFYWVGQRHDVEKWCESCNLCGSTKSPPKHRHAPLQTHVATGSMHCVAMDILGPLPMTPRSNKYVLVVGDYFTKFTKWTKAFAIADMETATVSLKVDPTLGMGKAKALHTADLEAEIVPSSKYKAHGN